MALTDRMKEARKNKGLTQEVVAKMVGVAKSTYTGYEKGNSEPNMLILSRIMNVLEVDANFLFQDEMNELRNSNATPQEMENIIKKYRSLDRYGQEAVENILDIEWRRCTAPVKKAEDEKEHGKVVYIKDWYPRMPMSAGTGQPAAWDRPEELELYKRPPRGTSFIAPVSGDSMEPTYHDGDKLFIRSCREIDVGEVGVFYMDGQQWVKELGDGVLISHNDEYEPIPMREDIVCQGLVLGVCDDSYFA